MSNTTLKDMVLLSFLSCRTHSLEMQCEISSETIWLKIRLFSFTKVKCSPPVDHWKLDLVARLGGRRPVKYQGWEGGREIEGQWQIVLYLFFFYKQHWNFRPILCFHMTSLNVKLRNHLFFWVSTSMWYYSTLKLLNKQILGLKGSLFCDTGRLNLKAFA